MQFKKYFLMSLFLWVPTALWAAAPNASTPPPEQLPPLSAANEQQRADQIDAMLNNNPTSPANVSTPLGLTQDVTVSGQLNVDGAISSGSNDG